MEDNNSKRLETMVKHLNKKKEIKNNPFSELPHEAIKEALKLLYEASEEFDTTFKKDFSDG
jgi:hypothetical protein